MNRMSRALLPLVVVLLPFLAACSNQARGPLLGERPERVPGIGAGRQTPEEIQAEIMIYVDRFWAVVSQTMDDVRRSATSPQRRLGAQSLKIVSVESAVRIATDPNPIVAVLDMTVMVTLMRQVWDDHWAPKVYLVPPGGAVSQAFASLEREIWTIAGRILDQKELDALRALISDMRSAYPDQVYVVNLRASEFAAERPRALESVSGGPSLLALFALDPLSSLAPATRELQSSRLLAERAFFYAMRLPGLLSWRTDRALLFAAAMPEVLEAQANIEELRSAGERFGDLAESFMPELERQRIDAIDQFFVRLTAERSATVKELFDGIAAERRAVVDLLRGADGQPSALLNEIDATARTATTLSDSVRETVEQARLLTQAIGEIRSGDDGGRPFDIREYQSVAQSATQTAQELTALVGSLNQLLDSAEWTARRGEVAATIDDVSAASVGVLNRAFALAVALVTFTVVLVFLAALGYRRATAALPRAARGGGAAAG